MNPAPQRTIAGRIPLAVKLAHSAFLCVLVPVYLRYYGPTNFLYYCDVALLLTAAGLWLGSPLLLSMPAIGILIPQALWIADFLGGLFGIRVLGMTAYMFDAHKPLFLRGLSLFHGWLPILLVWLVARVGYDRRALLAWTPLAWVLMLVCYFLMPAPGSHPEDPNIPVNINYVFGPSDERPQSWMPAWAYFALLMIGLPVLVFYPTHLILSRLPRSPKAGSAGE